jgi:hypothetical protein
LKGSLHVADVATDSARALKVVIPLNSFMLVAKNGTIPHRNSAISRSPESRLNRMIG